MAEPLPQWRVSRGTGRVLTDTSVPSPGPRTRGAKGLHPAGKAAGIACRQCCRVRWWRGAGGPCACTLGAGARGLASAVRGRNGWNDPVRYPRGGKRESGTDDGTAAHPSVKVPPRLRVPLSAPVRGGRVLRGRPGRPGPRAGPRGTGGGPDAKAAAKPSPSRPGGDPDAKAAAKPSPSRPGRACPTPARRARATGGRTRVRNPSGADGQRSRGAGAAGATRTSPPVRTWAAPQAAVPGPPISWGGVEQMRPTRAYAQQLVTTRLLDCLHDPVGHPSRLQGIHPGAR